MRTRRSCIRAGRQGASYRSPDLTVTRIDPLHFHADIAKGTFAFQGLPKLHAVMPKKRLTLDAARIDGTADSATKAIKTANLSGGVTGTMDSTSADGPEHFTFSGSVVNYVNAGGKDEQSADIEAVGGVNFGASNATVGRTLSLKGSHGMFHVRSLNGAAGLEGADLDGPVVIHFSGALMDKAKKKTNVAGDATGGHPDAQPTFFRRRLYHPDVRWRPP